MSLSACFCLSQYFVSCDYQLFSLSLSHTESNRQELVNAGAVIVFVQLLESQDEDVQFYCAAALSNLAVRGVYVCMSQPLSLVPVM